MKVTCSESEYMPLENDLVQRAANANMNDLYDTQAQLEVNM